MARIAGIELQDKWRVEYALTKIKGIGWSKSGEVLGVLKIKESARVGELSTDQISKIAKQLESYAIEGDWVRALRENVQRLKVMGSYRGMRHERGLPTRGQRTKSNARTKRGARRTVGSFRKEQMAKTQQS